MNVTNQMYGNRLLAVAAALGRLNRLGIDIIDVDLNRSRPVLTVHPCAAVKQLKGATFCRRGTPNGVINRQQANLEQCRIEWEFQL